MIPYITAAGHRNYAVCLPLYLHGMKALPESFPAIHEFMQGNFAVHRSPGPSNGIWTDLTIEQTYNLDGKIALLKGISQSPTVPEKYIKTAPLMTAVSEQVRSIVHMNTGTISAHHGDSDASMIFTEANVIDTIYAVTRTMVSPFGHQSNELVNVTNGEVAPRNYIIRTKEIGIAPIQEAKQGSKLKLPKLAKLEETIQEP